MRATNLKTNHLTAPIGIDGGPLLLSWQCVDGMRQTPYEIELTANGETVWQNGKVDSAAMHADAPAVCGSRVRGAWKVRLWDENDQPGPWSEAVFETGLAAVDWAGEWVDPETEEIDISGDDAINAFARPNWERKQAEKEATGKGAAEPYKPHRPASYLRKVFTALKGDARLYITAKGLYVEWLNGVRVGKGATTVWETWTGIDADGKPRESLNHYSYGAICGWLFGGVCGIHYADSALTIAPMPDKSLGRAKAAYDSPAGRIVSGWHYDGDTVTYEFEIPANQTAAVTPARWPYPDPCPRQTHSIRRCVLPSV